MSSNSSTFSETWHRIAAIRVSLRPSVEAYRTHFRGERWHVLEDGFSNQFLRVRPAVWDFLARLDGRRSVGEVWNQMLASHPEEAPGQEEVVKILAQLYQNNLICGNIPPDSAAAFQRHRKRRQRETRNRFRSILFFKVPLLDPDTFLSRTLPAAGWLFSRFGFILWLAVLGSAIKVLLDNWNEFASGASSVLAPSNLPLLYIAMAGIKLLHELGHGYSCKKYGGEVHVLGLMLLVFTPVPYVDASSSWRFRSKWRRIVVAGAGVYVELLVAAVAVFVWEGATSEWLRALAFNLVFIASVSTILFNLNPLLRFDGYYILSDWIGVPNLNQRANRQWKYLMEARAFGIRRLQSPSNSTPEASFYLFWGGAAWVYRLVLFAGILLYVADQFLLLGLLIAITGLITMVILPIGKVIGYLARSPRLERNRPRAIRVTIGLIVPVLAFLFLLPFPRSYNAPGVFRSVDYAVVFTRAAGQVQPDFLPSGSAVRSGDVVARLANRELELELDSLEARLREARSRERDLILRPGGGLNAIRQQIEALEKRVAENRQRFAYLTVRAPVDGIWISPDFRHYEEAWLEKGTRVGEVVQPGALEFTAVVSQRDAAYLFSEPVRNPAILLRGLSEDPLAAIGYRIIPGQQQILPSPALGWNAGGSIAVDAEDQSGQRTSESFFELVAELDPGSMHAAIRHGMSGKLRSSLPPEPVAYRWIRRGRQLLQDRFGI